MYRKALQDLIAWKNSAARKPLVLRGARQVGKSFLVKNLFASEFSSVRDLFQLLTDLKLAKKKLGLLLNFDVPTLPQGIVRLVS